MKTKTNFQGVMRAFDFWCAEHTLGAGSKSFMRSVILLGMAQANAWRDAERAEHAKSFEQVIRNRAGQIIGSGC